MKKTILLALSALAICLSTNTQAGSVGLTSISFTPDNPNQFESISATISGWTGTSLYHIAEHPKVEIELDEFEIEISIYASKIEPPPGTVVIQSVQDFSVIAELGQLAAGNWDISADIYLDGKKIEDASVSKHLAVSPVPLPAAAWLLMMGLVSLLAFKRNKTLT